MSHPVFVFVFFLYEEFIVGATALSVLEHSGSV